MASKFGYALGASITMIGVIASGHSIGALITKIIAAPTVDSFDRKHVLMFGLGFLAFVYAGYALSYSAAVLTIFRILQGAGMAFAQLVTLTMASAALPKKKMGIGIGYFTLSQAITQAIAPTVGIFLFEKAGYHNTFWCMFALTVGNILLASTLKRETCSKRPFRLSLSAVIAPECLVFAILILLLNCTYANINGYLVLYAESLGVEGISIYFTVYALTMLFTRPMIGRMADKYGIVKITVPCLVCFAFSFILISLAHSLPGFIIAALIAAFGYGGMVPALQASCMKCVSSNKYGAASSTNYVAVDIGYFLGPVIASWVIRLTGSYTIMWRVMLVPVILAGMVVYICRKHITEIDNL